MAIWVRAEYPTPDDNPTVNIFTTRKPIGVYSSEVPAIVRKKDANYYDGCKHYAFNCPNQPAPCAEVFPFDDTPLRERLIHDWLFHDKFGWQGMLGDPEEIYPEEIYPTTP